MRDDFYETAQCEFCDDHGVRLNGLYRCDHVDHTAAAQRGMAMIRQTMGWATP